MYEKLLHIGLTKTEAKIYVMLLDLSKAQAGVLSRKTGIHRRSIYDALDRLIEKGLVSYIIENDKRFYLPANPDVIEQIINRQKQDIDEILPELKAKFGVDKGRQETRFFRGIDGLKSVFEDQIAAGSDIYTIGASDKAQDLLKFYLPHYLQARKQKKIILHAIVSGGKRKIAGAKLRYLPSGFSNLVSTSIWGNNVAIFYWREDDPVAIVISQPDISKAFKNYFDLIWKIAKE